MARALLEVEDLTKVFRSRSRNDVRAIDGIDALEARRAAAARVTAVLEGNRTVCWRLNVRENRESLPSTT